MTEQPGSEELTERLSALEARVAELEGGRSAVAPPRGRPSAAAPAVAEPTTGTGDSGDTGDTDANADGTAPQDPFWALTSLKHHLPAPGGVLLTGAVDIGAGHLEYQWARPTEHLLETDWQQHASTVAALGHPLRMAILRRLVDGEHTVAQLVEDLALGSTGVAYHHLSALQAGGWVSSPRRGSWSLLAPRVIPLLTILIALEKG